LQRRRTPFYDEDKESQEQFITDLTDAEYNPLLEKITPNQNTLLAKGVLLAHRRFILAICLEIS
jgi:hypothetical protein